MNASTADYLTEDFLHEQASDSVSNGSGILARGNGINHEEHEAHEERKQVVSPITFRVYVRLLVKF